MIAKTFALKCLGLAVSMLPILGTTAQAANHPAGEPQAPVQRVLWEGTIMSSADWDWAAQAGFTLVHSYGSDWTYLRHMLDEAQKRGMKMIAGPSGFLREVPWLTIRVDRLAADAPTSLFPHVVQHFSMAEPKFLFYGGGMTGSVEGIEIPLRDPTNQTLNGLAATVNKLGHGIVATIAPGKGMMSSTNLGTDWYGDAVAAPVNLDGGEVNEDLLQRYVNAIKDHPALFCIAPFDDPDLHHFSPSYQRYLRNRLRDWAPRVPAYLLVSSQGMTPGIGGHDGRIAPDAFDGVITYLYPSDWENAGVFLDVDSIRTYLQDWWSLHARLGPKNLILLVSAFGYNVAQPPPPGAQNLQWRSAQASDVPLSGFGYYSWSGQAVTIQNTPRLQAEVAAVNHAIASHHGELVLEALPPFLAASEGNVIFQATWRGEAPANIYWEFGDGGTGWGDRVSHRFTQPGNYQATAHALADNGLSLTQSILIPVLGNWSPVISCNFDDSAAAGFVPQSGSWQVIDGAYGQTTQGLPDTSTCLDTKVGGQYRIEADIRLVGDREIAWLIYTGATNSPKYRLQIEPRQALAFHKEGSTAALRLWTDTGWHHTFLSFERNRFYHFMVDVLQGEVLVSVNGELLLRGRLDRLTGDGVIGFGGEGAAAQYDNLRVFAVAPLGIRPEASPAHDPEQPRRFTFNEGRVGGQEPVSSRWDFGDGTTSANIATTHSYATNGAYKVSLAVADASGTIQQKSWVLLAGPQVFYREAEDFDWSDGPSPGHPTEAAYGQHYGAGQKGRKGVDFRQSFAGRGDQATWRNAGEVSLAREPATRASASVGPAREIGGITASRFLRPA